MLSNIIKEPLEKLAQFGGNISRFVMDDINEKFYNELLNSINNVRNLLNEFVERVRFMQMDSNSIFGKLVKNDKLCELFKKRYSYVYKYNFLQNDVLYFESKNIKRTCIIINKSLKLDGLYIYDLSYYNIYKYFFNLLRNLNDNLKPLGRLPKFGELFAIKYCGIIYRAVRENEVSNSKYMNCFLLDYGIEIEVERNNTSFLDLPRDLKHHPSLALFCKLSIFSDNSKSTKEHFYENMVDPTIKYNFKIVNKEDDCWYIDLEEYHNPFSSILTQAEMQDLNILTPTCTDAQFGEILAENSINISEIILSSENCMMKYFSQLDLLSNSSQLTDYEKAILCEEPFNNSNTLKSIRGYDTKDTASTRKFVAQDEHLFNDVQSLSKWRQNKKIVSEKILPLEIPEIGSFIMIIPTAIECCTTFFGQVQKFDSCYPEPSIGELTRKWNSHEEMAKCEPYDSTPILFELVFAKYTDGFFYRAKVIQNRDNNYFVVIYLDYGNIEIVHLNDLRKWDKKYEVIPCQAEHFTFANVKVKPGKAEDLLHHLRSNFLNKTYVVKIISNADSLFVELYDKDGNENLLDKMIEEEFFMKVTKHISEATKF
ncbi:uncharacterized protein LOC129610813 isoform X2 [Condylostylus longicornis]|nr:uncharacterized protein LOC129610813 isoform X2 [Condylostylus longicornis]